MLPLTQNNKKKNKGIPNYQNAFVQYLYYTNIKELSITPPVNILLSKVFILVSSAVSALHPR